VKETTACPLPAVADIEVGAPGTRPDCEALEPMIGIYYTAVFRYLTITKPLPSYPELLAPSPRAALPTDSLLPAAPAPM
jgi:hypothetical protein